MQRMGRLVRTHRLGVVPRRLAAALVAVVLAASMLAVGGGSASAAVGDITTVAGTGTAGFSGNGGSATSAQLNNPAGLAFDQAGNLYIADTSNHRVRKVSTSGIISTYAGTGTAGFSGDGGPATSAQLNAPRGVAVGPDGTVYISDRNNHRVRRVNPSGTIATLAGTGTAGYSGDGGVGTSAKLSSPSGLDFRSDGNLYIADFGNCRIRRVRAGIITTEAGNGTCSYGGDGGAATSAQLSDPVDVAVADDGPALTLYIAELGNRVRKVTGAIGFGVGTITTVAGTGTAGYSGDGGPATSAKLYQPRGVALDVAGNLYIADHLNQRIRRVSPAGIITTVAGTGTAGYSGDGGPATSAELAYPFGLALDKSANLYLSEWWGHRVRRVEAVTLAVVPVPTVSPSPLPSPTLPPTPSPVPTPSVSPGPVPTAPNLFPEYPSDDCTAGTVVADGFAGTTYVKVRSDQPDSQTTRVCFAAEGFGEHAGGRVDVTDAGGSPATPTVQNDNACTSTPIASGDIGDEGDPDTHAHYEFRVDVNANDVWVCVSVDDVNRRVIVPVSEPPTVEFEGDNDDPNAPGDDPPTDALLPSSACQNNGGGKVVNTDLGSSHVWLYAWEESSTRAHVCVRAEGDSDAGGRLTIDTAGSPGVSPQVGTFTDQASQCNLNVISGEEPVAYSLRRSSATNPAWLCVDVEGTQHQVKLGASTGSQAIVTFTPDDPM